jgi:hypothetical protein
MSTIYGGFFRQQSRWFRSSRIVDAGTGARASEEYYVAVSPDSILAFWIATAT